MDNGSTDNSLDFIRPSASPRCASTGCRQNIGFAAGNDAGAEVATGEYLAFLNNDTRVDPAGCASSCASLLDDAGRGVVCTGSKMLDWDGREIDFVGGVMNFHAFGYQLSYGLPVAAEPAEYKQKRDLLFACGGAMLIRADVFREAGGFDPNFFAFFEDVDLGWRLWLMGHRVTLTPSAVTYHKGHGTASSIPGHRRLRALRAQFALCPIQELQRRISGAHLPRGADADERARAAAGWS